MSLETLAFLNRNKNNYFNDVFYNRFSKKIAMSNEKEKNDFLNRIKWYKLGRTFFRMTVKILVHFGRAYFTKYYFLILSFSR